MKTLVEFSPKREEDIKDLLKTCGFGSIEELINNSLTMFEWAVGEEKSGRYIASVDDVKNKYDALRMPCFDKIRQDKKDKSKKKPKKDHLKVIK